MPYFKYRNEAMPRFVMYIIKGKPFVRMGHKVMDPKPGKV